MSPSAINTYYLIYHARYYTPPYIIIISAIIIAHHYYCHHTITAGQVTQPLFGHGHTIIILPLCLSLCHGHYYYAPSVFVIITIAIIIFISLVITEHILHHYYYAQCFSHNRTIQNAGGESAATYTFACLILLLAFAIAVCYLLVAASVCSTLRFHHKVGQYATISRCRDVTAIYHNMPDAGRITNTITAYEWYLLRSSLAIATPLIADATMSFYYFHITPAIAPRATPERGQQRC